MKSPAPAHASLPLIGAAPVAKSGAQPTAVAALAGPASKPMPHAIAAPTTIGSRTTRARERLMLEELLRRFPRKDKDNATGRRAILAPNSYAARDRARPRVAPPTKPSFMNPSPGLSPRAGGSLLDLL